MYWDVLHSCEFCIQDSQGHISEVKRLAALHMAVDLYLPYLAKLISFACWKFCNQLTDSTINLWRKVWLLTFWGVITKPISMAGKTQWQNTIGRVFLWWWTEEDSFLDLTDYTTIWLIHYLSSSHIILKMWSLSWFFWLLEGLL